jgi:hypothetical protein
MSTPIILSILSFIIYLCLNGWGRSLTDSPLLLLFCDRSIISYLSSDAIYDIKGATYYENRSNNNESDQKPGAWI